MIYIRTIKNSYDIDIIIDSTNNQRFVETTGLEWICLPDDVDTLPENGSYYYEGKIIPLNSEDYDKIISPIINEIEEPLRIQREKEEQRLKEEFELEFESKMLEIQSNDEDEPESLFPVVPPDPLDIEEIERLKSLGAIDPRDMPPPTTIEFADVESTKENLEEWKEKYYNLCALVDALESKSYSEIVDNVVIFDPPLEFPCGVEQSHFPFPEETVDGYLGHLIKVKENYITLLDKMCSDLNLQKIT